MSDPASLSALLADSGYDGDALNAMQLTADTLGPQIAAGLSDVDIDHLPDEVLLLKLIVDDSSSISAAGNTDLVIEGANTITDALKSTKQVNGIVISCQFLNHGTLYGFRPLAGAILLDHHNYQPYGNTPLYDATGLALTDLVLELDKYEKKGITARGITAIVTDGADVGSKIHTPRSIKPIVQALIKSELHIVLAMGIDDCPQRCPSCNRDNVKNPIPIGVNACPACGAYLDRTDFKHVLTDMGLLPEWVLTPLNTSHDIRAAFRTVSQSAVASQTAGGTGFSKVAMGGFGAV